MKTKITFNQLKNLILEDSKEKTDNDPIVDLDGILILKTCPRQREMCWGFRGYIFADKNLNPDIDPDLPFINIINAHGKWQLHFENYAKVEAGSKHLDKIYSAISSFLKSGFELHLSGGATMGGLSGLSKLSNYGFEKVYLDDVGPDEVYWGGDHIDPKRAEAWMNNPKHQDEFWVKGEDGNNIHPSDFEGEFTLDNTYPRGFKMVKK